MVLTQKGTQTIRTERLLLRRFTVGDAPAMFENWANDERVTRFLTWEPHQSPEITKQLLEGWCAAYENPSTYNWLIEFRGKAIGSISVVPQREMRVCRARLLHRLCVLCLLYTSDAADE